MSLPASLRRRFVYLQKYTKEITLEKLEKRMRSKEQRREFLNAKLESIRTVVLVLAIHSFLEDGIAAAKKALETAKSLKMEGISIGSTVITDDCDELRAWEKVRQKLGGTIERLQIARFAQAGKHPAAQIEKILEAMLDEDVD